MSRMRSSDQHAPVGEEIIIAADVRLLLVVLLALVAAVSLGLWAVRSHRPERSAGGPPSPTVRPVAGQSATTEVGGIVTPRGAAPPSRATRTPGAPDGHTRGDPALVDDPNVGAEYRPLQPEKSHQQLDGPRIAISDLNALGTYNFGVVPLDRPADHEFQVANAGNRDLTISRIYTACGCMATTLGGKPIGAAGWVTPTLTLRPGESEVFTVRFDPRFSGEAGVLAKYVQVFSNDATRPIFDAGDPLSHEVRFRVIVEPR
jgi:hypothetical protein